MKEGSYFINVGRGSTVDEQALIEALRNGRLRGAGLDVFETEPLPPESPLWEMENVIITPHEGGQSPRLEERVSELFLENLRRYVSGEQLVNVVDRELGY
jgi:phosphoglycerate dehydrogenase-like enzyme